MVPNNPANPVTLQEAIETEDQLQRQIREDENVERLVNIGMQLEGLYRNASTHAAGVVIGDRLTQLVPLYQDPRSDMPATQFNMKWVEPAGLVKFDFWPEDTDGYSRSRKPGQRGRRVWWTRHPL